MKQRKLELFKQTVNAVMRGKVVGYEPNELSDILPVETILLVKARCELVITTVMRWVQLMATHPVLLPEATDDAVHEAKEEAVDWQVMNDRKLAIAARRAKFIFANKMEEEVWMNSWHRTAENTGHVDADGCGWEE